MTPEDWRRDDVLPRC